MKHILCITSGLRGILFASFELVNRLEAAGYRVTYASPRAVGDVVKKNGIDYRQLPETVFSPAPATPTFSGPLAKLKRLWYKWSKRRVLQKAAVNNLGMDHFRDTLIDIKPDLVIIDVELHEHLMTMVANGMPTLLLSQWFSLWNRPGLPPLVQATIPGQGWRGSQPGIQLAWWKIAWQRQWMFGKKYLRTAGTNRRAVLQLYAKKTGFSLAYMRENYWPGPFTYNELPVISMTLEEMEFPHDKRPNLHYVGAMIAENRQDSGTDPLTEKQLNELFRVQESTQAALICCTVSSFKSGDSAFLRRLVQAVREQPDWMLIIGLGGKLKAEELGELPSNVHAFAWIPQTRVLARADCSINHGGIHTINECVHFKVPMLIYSGKRSDQDGCAARIHYHGLGIMANKDQDDSAAIRTKITTILNDGHYRKNLNKMHEYHQQYRKNNVLATYVNTFLGH